MGTLVLGAALGLGGCYLAHEREGPPPPPAECRLPARGARFSGSGLCDFVGGEVSDHPVPLAAVLEDLVIGVDASGAPFALHRFGEGAPTEGRTFSRRTLAMRGRYAAAGGYWIDGRAGGPSTVFLELVLIDLVRREVVARVGEEVPYQSWGIAIDLRGNADGLFVYGVALGDLTLLGVLSEAWTEALPIEGFTVATDPDASGAVGLRRVRDHGEESIDALWLDLCLDLRTGETRPMRTNYAGVVLDEQVIAQTEEGLLLESAREVQRLDALSAIYFPSRLSPSRAFLLGTPEIGVYRGYGLEADRFIQRFEIRPPPGRRHPFRPDPRILDLSASNEAEVSSTGELLTAYRDDQDMRVYASLDGQEWRPLGRPMGEIEGARGVEVGGTYLLFGFASTTTPTPWPPPGPERLDRESVQLVRPSAGVEAVLEQAEPGISFRRLYELTAEGSCLAWATGATFHVFSAERGEGVEIDVSALAEPSYEDVGPTWAVASRQVWRR